MSKDSAHEEEEVLSGSESVPESLAHLPPELVLNERYDPICCRRDDYITNVFNQKSEEFCVPIAYADMITLIYQYFGGEPGVVLSPQPLVDCGKYQSLDTLSKILCDSKYGLVSIEEYPFIWKTKDKPWSWETYAQMDFDKRYFISELHEYTTQKEIRERLCHNFMDGGWQYPVIGYLNNKGRDSPAPKAAYEKNAQHSPKKGKATKTQRRAARPDLLDHPIIIFGLDTTDENLFKHSCWVKNTYGRGWGTNGVSYIEIKNLTGIVVPRYDHEAITTVRVSEDRKKREKVEAVSEEEKQKPIIDASSNEVKAQASRERINWIKKNHIPDNE